MAERSGNTQTKAMVKARTHIHYTDRLETLRGISVLQLTTVYTPHTYSCLSTYVHLVPFYCVVPVWVEFRRWPK